MAYDATGTIEAIFDTQQVSEKFSKREFVLNIPDGQYSNSIKFQFTGDKCDLLDQYATGQEVKVMFNLQGKPFTKNGTTMYFNNLNAWRIEPAGGTPKAPTTTPAKATPTFTVDDSDNDLPF